MAAVGHQIFDGHGIELAQVIDLLHVVPLERSIQRCHEVRDVVARSGGWRISVCALINAAVPMGNRGFGVPCFQSPSTSFTPCRFFVVPSMASEALSDELGACTY